MQKVKLGRLASNRPGLFTNGYMAMPISEEDYIKLFDMDWEMAKNYVLSRWGFELIGDLH